MGSQARSKAIPFHFLHSQPGTSGQSIGTQRATPLGPLSRLTSMIVSGGGCRLRTTNRTTGPASFSASTARLCTTSDTSTSFTRSTQSFTLWGKSKKHDTVTQPLHPLSRLLLLPSPTLLFLLLVMPLPFPPPPLRLNQRVFLSGSPPPLISILPCLLQLCFQATSPQPPVHGSCSTRNDLGNKDARVIRDMGVVNATCDAEAQTRIALQKGVKGHSLLTQRA